MLNSGARGAFDPANSTVGSEVGVKITLGCDIGMFIFYGEMGGYFFCGADNQPIVVEAGL